MDQGLFELLLNAFRRELAKARRMVPDLELAVPVAAYILPARYGESSILAHLVVYGPLAKWLYHFGDDMQRAKVLDVIGGSYRDKKVGRSKVAGAFRPSLRNALSLTETFSVDPDFRASDALRFAESHERKGDRIEWNTGRERTLDDVFTRWVRNVCPPGGEDDGHYRPALAYISPLALNAAGASNLQHLLRLGPTKADND